MTDLNFLQQQQLLGQHQIHHYNNHPQQKINNQLNPSILSSVSHSTSTNSHSDSHYHLDPNDPLNMPPGSSAQNFFNENVSPFFAPYGIDVSHFPLTNPPIFESALYSTDDSEPRSRRRISISNGQIGQIITTHTLNNDDLYDIQPPPYPIKQQQPHHHTQQLTLQQDLQGGGIVNPLTDNNVASDLLAQQQQQLPLNHSQPYSITPNLQPIQHQQQPIQQQQQQQQQQPVAIKREDGVSFPQTNNQGVPNHKLVYNNEIIFNPDAGPIPGTAAWKKARLLERNRIAASKCRQRKKAAQIQLKEDIVKLEKEIDILKKENGLLIDLYDTLKSRDVKGDVTLATLLNKITISLEKKADFEKAKAKEEAELDGDDDDEEGSDY